jgi:hypothetical protein
MITRVFLRGPVFHCSRVNHQSMKYFGRHAVQVCQTCFDIAVHRCEIARILAVRELDNLNCPTLFSTNRIVRMPVTATVIRYAVMLHPAIRVGVVPV